jgi:putative methanogen marker protein 4
MKILEILEKRARKKRCKIAIGAGDERAEYVEKVLRAAEAVDFADVIVVGEDIQESTDLFVIDSRNIEKDLIKLLKNKDADAVVRGSCDASKILEEIHNQFNPQKIGRVALLAAASGQEFFFAPVGIDEGNTIYDKVFLVREGVKLIQRLGFAPKVAVLSGGRQSDVGRHKNVVRTIREAEEIVDIIKGDGFFEIKNYNILVEDAIAGGANFIIAPYGITGNLMFRTLAFLGDGKVYGAPIVGIEEVFIDTSRAESTKEYIVALTMAGALASGS